MARQLHDDDSTFEINEKDLPGLDQPDETVTYTCRPLSTSKYREILKKNTKLVPNKATRGMDEKIDAEKVTDDLIDHVIASWVGVNFRGQPAECTRDFKTRLDGQVKTALIGVAGVNRIEAAPAAKEESFRPTP